MSSINNLLQSNPLIMDYIKNESRGLVMSYATVGFVFGEFLMIILFEFTRKLTILQQYWMPAVVIGLVSSVLIFLVRDPKIKKPDLDVSSDSDTSVELDNYSTNYENRDVPLEPGVWSKVKNLTLLANMEFRRNPKYLFVFLCLFVSRLCSVLFSVYLQLWVMNFYKTGVIATKEESDSLYMSIILGSLVTIAFVAPTFGYFSDKADHRIVVPASFLVRGIVAACFCKIENPYDWHAYILCILMVNASIIQFLSVEVLFMKDTNQQIRGTLSGIAFFFGSIGVTIFSLVGGILFDIKPWAPFLLVASADGVIILISVIFICRGLLN